MGFDASDARTVAELMRDQLVYHPNTAEQHLALVKAINAVEDLEDILPEP